MNQKLHSSTAYNNFQIGVSALAVFTVGMRQTMTCFVAGTMLLTAAGLNAIEHIKAGDKVISTDPATFETAEKSVLETYVRQTDKLLHLVIDGEEIVTTETHPFYVKDCGFVGAGKLQAGEHLLNANGKELLIEEFWSECLDEPTTVYNFQVEVFHTYHVGKQFVLVHNANYENLLKELAESGVKYNSDDVVTVMRNSDGKLMWLEKGNGTAGLKHILERHGDDFLSQGVKDIPKLLEEAVSTTPIKTGSNPKGLYADYALGENSYRVAYGTNGFVVSFYPID